MYPIKAGVVDPARLAAAREAHASYTEALDELVSVARADLAAGDDPVVVVADLLLNLAISIEIDPDNGPKMLGLLVTAVVREAQRT